MCNECELKGDISIGAKTVIHPKARIVAESGPIIIGSFSFLHIEFSANEILLDVSPNMGKV